MFVIYSVCRPPARWKWKLRADNTIKVARARRFCWKGAELKVLKGKEQEIRHRNAEFKKKLNWILAKRRR